MTVEDQCHAVQVVDCENRYVEILINSRMRAHRHYLSSVIVFIALTWAAQAQRSGGITGVTRPTILSPAVGFQSFVPLTNSTANIPQSSVIAPALPRVVYRFERKEDPAEVDKRVLAFQQKRAEEGSPSAQFDLARRYFLGQGVPKDFERARKWLKSSAAAGHTQATKLLDQIKALEAAPGPE